MLKKCYNPILQQAEQAMYNEHKFLLVKRQIKYKYI